jgi:hypothetical protein
MTDEEMVTIKVPKTLVKEYLAAVENIKQAVKGEK